MYLCPVHALADWVAVSGINEGYLFRKMASGDRVAEANSPMVRGLGVVLLPIADNQPDKSTLPGTFSKQPP
jgi:hypothetical protein